jgi:soluble lytic murein transglycosylase-like protein
LKIDLSRVHRFTMVLTISMWALVAAVQPASAQIQLGAQQQVPLASLQRALDARAPSLSRFTLRSEPLPGTLGVSFVAIAERKTPYDSLIGEHAELNALRPELVKAMVRAESAFNPSARSPKGAMGLMQLMPATARQFGVSNPLDPEQNIRAGTAYFRQLLDKYHNNEALALAAYNAGPGAVDKYGQTIPPYRETRQYVSKVSDLASQPDTTRLVGTPIYKVTELVNGVEKVTYTNRKTR